MQGRSLTRNGPVDVTNSPYARWQTLTLDSVLLREGFWAQRKEAGRVGLRACHDQLEQTGLMERIRFVAGCDDADAELATAVGYRGDTPADKWVEGIAYEIGLEPDQELEAWAEEFSDLMAAMQTAEGYCEAYLQMTRPGKHLVDLGSSQELYSLGHLIQAGIALKRMTGKSKLLDVARRFADYVDEEFGPGKRRELDAHPEVEMALVELYRETGEHRYLELAKFFIDQRGYGLIQRDRKHRRDSGYFQDHVPVREAETVVGHAVRQLYLNSGVTDLYLETGEQALMDALMRQWQDMVGGKLFITGGVGSRHRGEAFGEDYELPNDQCYCETCAQIASIMWNWRMLLATGQGRFADLMERTLYNGFLSGVSLDGRRFFYVNPLMIRSGQLVLSGNAASARREWFPCPCCPPNVTRLLSSVGHYFATKNQQGIQVHLYGSAVISAEMQPGHRATLRMDTAYPWQGRVKLTVEEAGTLPWLLALRIPAWCDEVSIDINGRSLGAVHTEAGYAIIERRWKEGDRVTLELPMAARLTEAHPRIDPTRCSVAIERGPIVYCLEQCDQPESINIHDVQIDEKGALRDSWESDLLDGVMTVQAPGYTLDVSSWQAQLYRPLSDAHSVKREPISLTAVPYFAWANREPGAMRVWIPRAMP